MRLAALLSLLILQLPGAISAEPSVSETPKEKSCQQEDSPIAVEGCAPASDSGRICANGCKPKAYVRAVVNGCPVRTFFCAEDNQ